MLRMVAALKILGVFVQLIANCELSVILVEKDDEEQHTAFLAVMRHRLLLNHRSAAEPLLDPVCVNILDAFRITL